MTEYSSAPVEPADGQSGPAAKDGAQSTGNSSSSALSQDERAELEQARIELAELEQARIELAELEQARIELAELRQKAAGTGRRHRFGWRSVLAVVLIVLGSVLAPVAVVGTWTGREVSNTDRWVATVEPLIHDPAIQNVLTDKITDQITSQLNLTGTINQAASELNDRGLIRISSLLTTFSPRISDAVTGFIHSTVQKFITSPAAANIWVQVNTIAHQGMVKVLSGQGDGGFSVSDDQVVLNLGPFIAAAKQDLAARGFTLVSHLPSVNPTVALFEAKYLEKGQALYRLINTLKIVLPILGLVLLCAGVFAARNRRRALFAAGVGLSVSMLVLAIALLIARSIYLGSVPSSVLPGDAAAAAYDTFVYFLKLSLRVVLAVGLVVAAGAYFTGPAAGAVKTRSTLRSWLGWLRRFGERKGVSTGPFGDWIYAHRKGLRIGSVTLFALIFVFLGQPTALAVILLVVLLLVVLALIELIGRPAASSKTGSSA